MRRNEIGTWLTVGLQVIQERKPVGNWWLVKLLIPLFSPAVQAYCSVSTLLGVKTGCKGKENIKNGEKCPNRKRNVSLIF